MRYSTQTSDSSSQIIFSNIINLTHKLTITKPPVNPTDAVNKGYVDNAISSSQSSILSHINNTVIHSNASFKNLLDSITVSGSEINQLSGMSYDVQSAINDKLNINGDTTSNYIILNNHPTQPNQISTKQYIDDKTQGSVSLSPGIILEFPANYNPVGFLKCNGAVVSKTVYSSLYNIIGNTYAVGIQEGGGKPWVYQSTFNNSDNSSTALSNGFNSNSIVSGVVGTSYIVTKNLIYGFNSSGVIFYKINSDGTITGPFRLGNNNNNSIINSSSSDFQITGTSSISVSGSGYYATVDKPLQPGNFTISANPASYTVDQNNSASYQLISHSVTYLVRDPTATYVSAFSQNFTAFPVTVYVRFVLNYQYKDLSNSQIYNKTQNIDGNYVVVADNGQNSWVSTVTYSYETTSDGLYTFRFNPYPNFTITVNSKPYDPPPIVYADPATFTIDGVTYQFTSSQTTNYTIPVDPNTIHSGYYSVPVTIDGSGYISFSFSVNSYGTAPPVNLSNSSCFVLYNKVYLVGGTTNNSTFSSSVYFCGINSDGILGAWSIGPSLPSTLAYSKVIVTTSKVYVIGGQTNSTTTTSSVYSSIINSDGTLSSWVTETSLPGPLSNSNLVLTNNRVYLLGGSNGSSTVSTVYTAPINADGTLGTWTTGTSIPQALKNSQSVITSNIVYLFGGNTGSTNVTSVYKATINSDGTIGSWTSATSLPSNTGITEAILTNSKIYILNAGGSQLSVGNFAGGLNDYSQYYSIQPNTSTLFKLPDMTSYRKTPDKDYFIKF